MTKERMQNARLAKEEMAILQERNYNLYKELKNIIYISLILYILKRNNETI